MLPRKIPSIWEEVKKGKAKKVKKHALGGKPIPNFNVNMVDNDRLTILHHAVKTGKLEVVKPVVEHLRPDSGARTYDGTTPLMLACKEKCSVELIMYLIEHKGTKEGDDDPSPLEYALLHNRADLARAIIVQEGISLTSKSVKDALDRITHPEMLRCLASVLDALGLSVPNRNLKIRTKRMITAIWSAVKESNVEELQRLVSCGRFLTSFNVKMVDNDRWTILHHAVKSRNLEVVKLVAECLKPDSGARTYDGTTPLMLACKEKCSVELIMYLIEHKGTQEVDDDPSPLDYALLHNRIDLARAIIAHEGNSLTSKSVKNALDRITKSEMLRCLLSALHAQNLGLVKNVTMLEKFSARPCLDPAEKFASFKLLYSAVHRRRQSVEPERYRVNSILKYALLSAYNTSLAPGFIEAELKWETRAPIVLLYQRLAGVYDLLPLAVLSEYGPVSCKKSDLDVIFNDNLNSNWSLENVWWEELLDMLREATHLGDYTEYDTELFEEFAKFRKTMKLKFFDHFLHKCIPNGYGSALMKWDDLYDPSYHRVIDGVMIFYLRDNSDGLIFGVLYEDSEITGAVIIYPLLKYCTNVLMHPHSYSLPEYTKDIRLFNWIMHLFGPWKAIQEHVGEPLSQLFTLKRFARDVVREAVFLGIGHRNYVKPTFQDRLEALPISEELKKYLRFYDDSSIKYFEKHAQAIVDTPFETFENDVDLPYPIVI